MKTEGDDRNNFQDIPSDRVTSVLKGRTVTPPQWQRTTEDFTWPSGAVTKGDKVCILRFEIPSNIDPPIFFYYRLDNFYQNHRRYVKSLDTEQLKGKARTAGQIRGGECDPLETDESGRPYYPCGLIANSMFNDTFADDGLSIVNPQANEANFYNMTTKGISWSTEGDLYGKSEYKPKDVVPPPNWKKQFPDNGYDDLKELPNLHTWEAFQVWMRTAGLPTFSKLAMRNDKDVLKISTYQVKIFDRKRDLRTFI